MKLEFSAGGIVYKRTEGKIFICLIKDHDDQWTFPKGHIEKGEKPEEAAVREISEEIGVNDLTVKELLGKLDYWFKDENELIHKYVYIYLLEAPRSAELTPQTEEIHDASWHAPSEAIEIIGYQKENQPLLELALKKLQIVLE